MFWCFKNLKQFEYCAPHLNSSNDLRKGENYLIFIQFTNISKISTLNLIFYSMKTARALKWSGLPWIIQIALSNDHFTQIVNTKLYFSNREVYPHCKQLIQISIFINHFTQYYITAVFCFLMHLHVPLTSVIFLLVYLKIYKSMTKAIILCDFIDFTANWK